MTSPTETWTSDGFEVSLSRHGGVDVVAVRGEIDVATSPKLRAVVTDPEVCVQPSLVVDLTSVEFLDSTAIGVLIAARRRSGADGRRFAIVCPPGQARRVIDMVALPGLIDVFEALPEALSVLELV